MKEMFYERVLEQTGLNKTFLKVKTVVKKEIL
jgi:hypothetical protein